MSNNNEWRVPGRRRKVLSLPLLYIVSRDAAGGKASYCQCKLSWKVKGMFEIEKSKYWKDRTWVLIGSVCLTPRSSKAPRKYVRVEVAKKELV